jgi:hypothetical protein
VRTVFLAVATVVVASVGFMACLFLRETTRAVAHIDQLAVKATIVVDRSKEVVNQASEVVALMNLASRQTAAYYTRGILQANDIERDSRYVLDHLGRKTLPELDTIVTDSDNALKALTLDTHDELLAMQGATEAVHSATDSLTLDFDDLHSRIDDPRIDSILGNVQSTTFELAGTTADIHTEIHKFVYPPPRKWWQTWIVDPVKIGAKMLTIPLR